VGSGLAGPGGPGRSTVPAGRGAGGGNEKQPGPLRRAWQRVGATLAAIAAFLAKFGALLIKLKYIGLVLSMLVSIVAYSFLFGWSFAVGIVLLILVHEMGHVFELRRQGVPASAPLFIPFMGAFVSMKSAPRSAFQEAMSGLAGPLVGTAASGVVAFWANATGSRFLMALAFSGSSSTCSTFCPCSRWTVVGPWLPYTPCCGWWDLCAWSPSRSCSRAPSS